MTKKGLPLILQTLGLEMNYRLMLEKTADLLVNLAVASVAVSAFQDVWYGIIMALFSYLLALLICARLGGNS